MKLPGSWRGTCTRDSVTLILSLAEDEILMLVEQKWQGRLVCFCATEQLTFHGSTIGSQQTCIQHYPLYTLEGLISMVSSITWWQVCINLFLVCQGYQTSCLTISVWQFFRHLLLVNILPSQMPESFMSVYPKPSNMVLNKSRYKVQLPSIYQE